MNFQEKLFESTADLRARAAALSNVVVTTARARAQVAAKRVDALKRSFGTLTVAGRELNKVARRHAIRFVKENSTIAVEAGKDVSALARTTYATLAKRGAVPQRPARRKPPANKPPARQPDLPRLRAFGHATPARTPHGVRLFLIPLSPFLIAVDFRAAILLCLVKDSRHLKDT